MPTDIITDRITTLGPKLLRSYIDFAINGEKTIMQNTSDDENGWFDSPFEESVYKFITSHGYDVRTQVGCSGYRIDMAVRHPEYNGRFVLGIECDGAAYHSARTARERDRLRQDVLENMGWKIYRIWSTDWIKDTAAEGSRLLNAIKLAIDEYHEFMPSSEPADISESKDFLDISEKTENEIKDERYCLILSEFAGCSAKDIPMSDFENTMMKVLENGFGYTKTSLFAETAKYGYLWKRQGPTIKNCFEEAYNNLIKQNRIIIEDEKIKTSN